MRHELPLHTNRTPTPGDAPDQSLVRRDLDVRALRCLLTLKHEKHYGRAAQRLHLSQPGLSRVIAKLERDAQATLVERSSRPVQLTRHGEILAEHALRILNEQRLAFDRLTASVPQPDRHQLPR